MKKLKAKERRKLLGLDSESSEEEDPSKVYRRTIVTYKKRHTIKECRNSFILGMMSSSPSIKSEALALWLVDNCGFSIGSMLFLP